MWESGDSLGGYKKRNGSSPQRSKLIADKERRSICASQAFALYRPVSEDSTAEIYERTHRLQQEFDIPEKVKLYSHDMHSTIIQEKRVFKGLVNGMAKGFKLAREIAHIENGMPAHGRSNVTAMFTDVDVIGRNRNIIIGHIEDGEGILRTQSDAAHRILDDLGLTLGMDRKPHITLGVSKAGLTGTERKHVTHTVFESIMDVAVLLLPVEIEHNGVRVPLDCAKDLG